MTSVSNNQPRPPPPPPPPPPAPPPAQQPQQAQQNQQQPAVSQVGATGQQQQNNTTGQQQNQPYVHPFEKSSFEASADAGQKPAQANTQQTNPAAKSDVTEPHENGPVDLADNTQNKNKSTQNTGTQNTDNVQQTNGVDCGEAALATVLKQNNPNATDEQLRNQVRNSSGNGVTSVNQADGINPQEMAQLAGQQGLSLDKSFGNFDAGALQKHVEKGGQAMMLVDSNALQNAQSGTNDKTGQGNQHWVVVDGISGKDQQGKPIYNIKDPSTPNPYTLTSDQLANSVNSGRQGSSETGAGLLVNPGSAAGTTQQIQQNVNTASVGTTGDDDGTGRPSSTSAATSNYNY